MTHRRPAGSAFSPLAVVRPSAPAGRKTSAARLPAAARWIAPVVKEPTYASPVRGSRAIALAGLLARCVRILEEQRPGNP
jgi:hypothetical protein